MHAQLHKKRDTCIVTTDRYNAFYKISVKNTKDLHEDNIFDTIDETCAKKNFKEYGIIMYEGVYHRNNYLE